MDIKKIAGIVVAYNIDKNILLENINTYINYIDLLIIVDNSDKKSDLKSIKNTKIKYINLNGNYGIAKALNIGMDYAIKKKYDYVLTMDQDSYFENNILKEYMKLLKEKDQDKDNIAIISPVYDFDRRKFSSYDGIKEKKYVMQSANLVNVSIWKETNGYKNEFFIDVVDYEYCLRCKKLGYKIYECGTAVLKHNPGITKSKKILGKELKYGYCSPDRIFYQARNLLWTAKKYNSIDMYCILLMKLTKIILLFDNKKEFLNAFASGIKDSKNNKFGKRNVKEKNEK